MNFEPINGLRILAVELGLLCALTVAGWVVTRLVRPRLNRPVWLRKTLEENLRAALLVIAVAVVGRAAIFPWAGIPELRINDDFNYSLEPLGLCRSSSAPR
jgi:hypothetical protein